MTMPSPETQLVIAEAKVRLLTEACEQLAVELARRTATVEDVNRILGAVERNYVGITRPDTRNLEHGSVDVELYQQRLTDDARSIIEKINHKAFDQIRRRGAPPVSPAMKDALSALQAHRKPRPKKP